MKYIFKGKSSRILGRLTHYKWYRTWGEAKQMTWAQAKQMTWNEFKNRDTTFGYVYDDVQAYTKAILANTKYGNISKIGGKTVAFNQYVDAITSDLWRVQNASTATVVSIADGVFKFIVSVQYAGIRENTYHGSIVNGHKYYQCMDIMLDTIPEYTPSSATIYWPVHNIPRFDVHINSLTAGQWKHNAKIVTATGDKEFVQVMLNDGRASGWSNVNVKNAMIFDLTTMFGAGNEPTLEECEQIFANDYYPQNAGELKNAAVNKVVIGNIEKAIPAAVQALDGYGWSAGTVYNSVEWVDGRAYFHKRIASVDLGSLTPKSVNWRADSNGVGWLYDYNDIPSRSVSASIIGNAICPSFETVTYDSLYYKTKMGISLFNSNSYGLCVWQADTSLTTAAAIKTAMNGIMLYYELAEEVVTDITEYFAEHFDYIATNDAETITFENNLDGLHLPVFNEIRYFKKL